VGGGLTEVSTAAEHSTSRLAFGLGMMASGASRGALGLRSVEFGLMGLLPGLGWTLVAVTAAVEAWHLLSHAAEEYAATEQKFIEKNTVALNAMESLKVKQDRLRESMAQLKTELANGPNVEWIDRLNAVKAFLFGDDLSKLSVQAQARQRVQEAIDTRNQTEAINQANEARNRAAEVTKRHEETITGTIRALERERATFGMTQAEIQTYELRTAGASRATLAHAQALTSEIDALTRAKKAAELQAEALRKLQTQQVAELRELESAQARIMEEGSKNLERQYERRQELTRTHVEALKGLFTSAFRELTSGNLGGALRALGEYGIGQLLGRGEDKTEMAGFVAPPMGPDILGRLAQQRALSAALALPPVPAVTLSREMERQFGSGSARGGHSFSSAVHVDLRTNEPQDTARMLRKHKDLISGLAAEGIMKSGRLTDYMAGNQ
jgi:hypothetical protein